MPKAFDTPEWKFDDIAKSYSMEWTPTPSYLIVKQVAEMIASDREGKVRQALIDLGWTPPSSSDDDDALCPICDNQAYTPGTKCKCCGCGGA